MGTDIEYDFERFVGKVKKNFTDEKIFDFLAKFLVRVILYLGCFVILVVGLIIAISAIPICYKLICELCRFILYCVYFILNSVGLA